MKKLDKIYKKLLSIAPYIELILIVYYIISGEYEKAILFNLMYNTHFTIENSIMLEKLSKKEND